MKIRIFLFLEILNVVITNTSTSTDTSSNQQYNVFDNIHYYPIQQYDGKFYTTNSINANDMSLMYWPTFIDYDAINNQTYFISQNNHVVYNLNNAGETKIIAGRFNKQGFHNGQIFTSLLNNPSGIVYYKKDLFQYIKLKNQIQFAIKTNMTDCSLIYTQQEYKKCKDEDLNNPQKQFSDIGTYQLISDEQIQEEVLKEIKIMNQEQLDELNEEVLLQLKYIFIADRNNNCIRRVSLHKNIVETYSGQCDNLDQSELMLQYKPQYLSIDQLGNLFVYQLRQDEHQTSSKLVFDYSSQIQMIDHDQNIYYLQWGACQEVPLQQKKNDNFFKVGITQVMCHRNWQKKLETIIQEDFCLKFRYACNFENLTLICKSFINGTGTYNMPNSCSE